MPAFVNLKNKRFGRLTAKKLAPRRKGAPLRWHCVCDCGKKKTVLAMNLANSSTQSCGCLNRERLSSRRLPDAALNIVMSGYIGNAKARGLEWKLSKAQFKILTQGNCFFTGRPPAQIAKARSGEIYIYNGIDRLNNDQGYTVENCVSCCSEVNYAKGQLSLAAFVELCCLVARMRGNLVLY